MCAYYPPGLCLWPLLKKALKIRFVNFRCNAIKDDHEDIDFRGDLVNLLAKESNYGHDLDIRHILHAWKTYKEESIMAYRDKAFASKYTGHKSPIHHSTFMEAMDDSLECFVGEKK